MPRSLVGSGVALDHTTNYGTMIDLHRAVNPTTMLGMVDAYKDSPKIWQLSKDLPNAKIVARVYHEHEGGYAQPPTGPGDTRHMIAEPEAILNEQVELGRNGLMWLHVMNEPSLFMKPFEVQKTIDWLVKFIGLAAPENCYCVLGNFADRHPAIVGGMWDPITWPLLRKIAQFPKLMKLGLHFYGPDKVADVMTALNATCKELRISPPQVVGTEFGLDSTGQGDANNGYADRGLSGEEFYEWEEQQVQGDLKPFAQSGQLVGLQTFQWNPLWGPFNIANDEGYQKAYKAGAMKGELEVIVITTTKPTYKPGVAPDTLTGGHYYKVGMPTGIAKRNLRALPEETSADIGDVVNAAIVCLFDAPLEYDTINRKWQWCILMNGHEVAGTGWLWTDGIQLIATTKPEPPVVIPTPTPTPTPELVKYEYALAFTIRAARLDDSKQVAITNAIKALLAGAAWLGAGIGTNEIEVDVELSKSTVVSAT